MERKLARFGMAGKAAAWTCQFNTMERLFVRHRNFRRLLDYVMFGPKRRRDQQPVIPAEPAETISPAPAPAPLFNILPQTAAKHSHGD
jgi:hypothetical protein